MEHTNRKQLTEQVISLLGEKIADVKKRQVEEIVEGVFETLKTNLKEGKAVRLNGFGTLKVSERKARNGVNPKTSEKIVIPATKTVTFKPATELKDLVKG